MFAIPFRLSCVLRRQQVPKGTPVPGYRALAQEVGYPGVTDNSIQNWYSAGTRLIYLAAASELFLVVVALPDIILQPACTLYPCSPSAISNARSVKRIMSKSLSSLHICSVHRMVSLFSLLSFF